jgi:hypothetical protein
MTNPIQLVGIWCMAKTTDTLAAGVVEHDGMLWKPKRGATATFEEFVAARALFVSLHRDNRWNPWVLEDRGVEYEHALQVMDQWRRAEPGFRALTAKQVEARMAKQDRARERQRVKEESERAARAAHYDPKRVEARLALIEHQSRLEHELAEVADFRSGSRFPAMDPKRRHEEIAKLEESIEHRRREIERLTVVVGDPEEAVDEHGWLPRERRERMLLRYKYSIREPKVRRLRQEILQLEAALNAATEKKERQELRRKVDSARWELDELLAVPPLTAEEMCSECPTPMSQHGWVTPPFEGPCPAWPGWAARLRRAREILETASRSNQKATQPPAPKPEPLAVIPSGLPIAEVMQRLVELQKQYPDAEVRRGRANRWELWPKAEEPE